MVIAPPYPVSDEFDREQHCADAIDAALSDVERAAVEAGWNPVEVAIAMMDLGKARLQAMMDGAEVAVSGGNRLPH